MADSPEVERRPPQAVEAEVAVLGAALLDADAIPRVVQFLRPEHFYVRSHAKVYEAILRLFEQNRPCDVVTVTDELKRMKEFDEVGGQSLLATLVDSVLTSAHCEEHAKLVLERAMQRQLIQTATEIVQLGYDESRRAEEVIDEAEQRIFRIREVGTPRGFALVHDLLMKEMVNIERALTEKRRVTGVETGFVELDEMTSGLQDGELVVVAGRPSMGKTAFALNVAVHASTKHKMPVAIFSLEMSCESLIQRLLCAEAGISLQSLRRGALNREERVRLTTALGPLGEALLFIDDSPALTALDIRARARRLRSEYRNLGLIIVDYLQLMEVPGDRRRERNRQQEVADISRSLKAMAKELNVPVIAVSQLSREPEKRSDRKPQLSDLRESGAIEQDADLVLLLYRGEHYFPNEESLRGRAEVIIAKQRNGPLGTVNLTFRGHCMRFENPYFAVGPEPVHEDGYDTTEPPV